MTDLGARSFLRYGMENEKDFEEKERVYLPEIYVGKGDTRRHRHLGIVLALVVALAAVALLAILITAQSDGTPSVPTLPDESEGEWRGAFAERECYESATAVAVALRVGAGASETRWSGVIFDSEGWIVTSSEALGQADDGRIYVTLSDGREYPCLGVARSGGAAFLRISAKGISAPRRGEDTLLAGESVVAIREGTDVLSGSAISVGQPIRLDISYSDELRGAPVFGEDGRLVGIVTHNDGDICAISINEIVKFWADLRK